MVGIPGCTSHGGYP